MKLDLASLKKEKIVWLGTHTCKTHRVNFLEHPKCYQRENPEAERIGFLDIEASNLDADFGIMLSYCIKEYGRNKIYSRTITLGDIRKSKAGDEDKAVVRSCIEDIKKFNRVVTWYGARFDIPFTRTRALMTGVKYPELGSLYHNDIYYFAKHKLKLSSNRLENVCRTILGRTLKTHIEQRFWRGGMRGDTKSLRYILDHNRRDVIDLEAIWRAIDGLWTKRNTSI